MGSAEHVRVCDRKTLSHAGQPTRLRHRTTIYIDIIKHMSGQGQKTGRISDHYYSDCYAGMQLILVFQ